MIPLPPENAPPPSPFRAFRILFLNDHSESSNKERPTKIAHKRALQSVSRVATRGGRCRNGKRPRDRKQEKPASGRGAHDSICRCGGLFARGPERCIASAVMRGCA